MGSGPNWCNQNESRKLCRSCKEDSLVPPDLKLWGCEPGTRRLMRGKLNCEMKQRQSRTDRQTASGFWVGHWNLSISSVQFSCSVVSDSLWPHEPQHTRPPCPSPTSGVHPNPCPLSQWCHPTISSSVVPFFSCLQSFPASGSFPMSQLFASGGQSIGISASTSVLPMNTQDWSPLGWTGWISLQSKRLSRVFSNTTVQISQSSHA